MGWTGTHAAYYTKNGKVDRKRSAHFEMFERWNGYECVADALVGTTYYAAVRDLSTDEVFALVCLTQVDNSDYYNFIYKDMDETYGPCQCACPTKILGLLTPTDSPVANEWRARCREYHKKASSPTAFKNIKEGTEVEWIVPHDGFTGLCKGDRVRLVKRKLRPYVKRSPYVWIGHSFYIRPNLVDEADISPVEEPCHSLTL